MTDKLMTPGGTEIEPGTRYELDGYKGVWYLYDRVTGQRVPGVKGTRNNEKAQTMLKQANDYRKWLLNK